MSFEGFLKMMHVGSLDSLDMYDGRLLPSPSSIDRLSSLLASRDGSNHGSDLSSTPGNSLRGGVNGASVPAADAQRYSWQKPAVNFNFDFGGPSKPAAAPVKENVAPSGIESMDTEDVAPAPASASGAAANIASVSSYFNNGAVRGGVQFDKRMHGASLYRNAVVQRVGPGQQPLHPGAKKLAPVRE